MVVLGRDNTSRVPSWARWFGLLGLALGLCSFAWLGGCDPKSGTEVVAEQPSDGGGDTPDGTPSDTVPKDTAPIDTTPTNVIQRKWTYRFIAGVSMGGGMSSIIGTRNHEKFDIIGTLGAPNDFRYLMHYISQGIFTGFCDLKKIEEAAKAGTLNTAAAYCADNLPKPKYEFEFLSHYNNWHYDDAGGNWNRTAFVRVLQDLTIALGNSMYHNPKSAYWPHPDIPNDRRTKGDRCDPANVIKVKGVKHWKYNPEGKYDLITFCDGNSERNGIYRPDRPGEHTSPAEVVLAVDVNGNGKRDFGEPVIEMKQERYDDVGIDGCANDREDGKGGCVPEGQKGPGGDANKDDYDPVTNPKGTEGNLKHDDKEPYKDWGLDGIENTKDYGEGDGKFTMTPGYKNALEHSPRDLIEKMTKEQISRLNIYIDGGIRDLFNFHITGLLMAGALRGHYPDQPKRVQQFNMFSSLMPDGSKTFDHTAVDWSTKGQHVFVRYGDPNAGPELLAKGDGDHVHGGRIIDRIFGFLSFVKHHMPEPDLNEVTTDRTTVEGKVQHFTYDSKALNTKHMYSVVLPPGYHANEKNRYPVFYFGHGYGMSGPDMANILVALVPAMANGDIPKMIMVSLHGSCKQVLPIPGQIGRFNETPWGGCSKGTFYINAKGVGGQGLKMEDAFFEVVSEVEKKYGARIRQPDTRPYKLPIPQ